MHPTATAAFAASRAASIGTRAASLTVRVCIRMSSRTARICLSCLSSVTRSEGCRPSVLPLLHMHVPPPALSVGELDLNASGDRGFAPSTDYCTLSSKRLPIILQSLKNEHVNRKRCTFAVFKGLNVAFTLLTWQIRLTFTLLAIALDVAAPVTTAVALQWSS